MRKYTLNEDFFDKIDTEEKAYWLGFIAADGCVYCAKNVCKRLIIALNRGDRGHLQKFLDAIESNHPIVDKIGYKNTQESWITICSAKMFRDLNNVGITPAKSQTAIAWNGPSDLMQHYWRGVMDGDGFISNSVGIVGSEFMVKSFLDYSREICGTTSSAYDRDSYWLAQIGGRRMAAKLLREIYGNATVALDRKQLLANQWIEQALSVGGGARPWP